MSTSISSKGVKAGKYSSSISIKLSWGFQHTSNEVDDASSKEFDSSDNGNSFGEWSSKDFSQKSH